MGDNSAQGDHVAVEYEPVQIDQQTEVKIPVAVQSNPDNSISPMITNNVFADDSDVDDEDDVAVADVDTNAHTDNNGENGPIQFDKERLSALSEYSNLLQLLHDVPKDMFVDRVLLDYEQSESKLEEIRVQLFEFLKSCEQFPFGTECGLKRRLNTRYGDSVCVKIAYDIHSLMLVTDSGDISFIREMLSISKKSRQSTASASLARNQRIPDKCSCSAEIAPLKNALSILQADLLLIKQRQAAAENLKATDIQSVNQSVKDLKDEIASVNQTMHNNIEKIKVQFSDAGCALQQRVTQCNSTVATNSKQIFELQQSVTKALNQMRSNLDETLVNMTSKINDLLPCTNTSTTCLENGRCGYPV